MTDCKNTLNYPRSRPGVEREDDPSSGCFMADVKDSRVKISRHKMVHERWDQVPASLLCDGD